MILAMCPDLLNFICMAIKYHAVDSQWLSNKIKMKKILITYRNVILKQLWRQSKECCNRSLLRMFSWQTLIIQQNTAFVKENLNAWTGTWSKMGENSIKVMWVILMNMVQLQVSICFHLFLIWHLNNKSYNWTNFH